MNLKTLKDLITEGEVPAESYAGQDVIIPSELKQEAI